mmetsp:Transcript_30849/g.76564  ORF Transcript_30849/g.76564 Transcript_30849/m.76564 type:complete len:251 (+) Transcript_30849:346-1098(+)
MCIVRSRMTCVCRPYLGARTSYRASYLATPLGLSTEARSKRWGSVWQLRCTMSTASPSSARRASSSAPNPSPASHGASGTTHTTKNTRRRISPSMTTCGRMVTLPRSLTGAEWWCTAGRTPCSTRGASGSAPLRYTERWTSWMRWRSRLLWLARYSTRRACSGTWRSFCSSNSGRTASWMRPSSRRSNTKSDPTPHQGTCQRTSTRCATSPAPRPAKSWSLPCARSSTAGRYPTGVHWQTLTPSTSTRNT